MRLQSNLSNIRLTTTSSSSADARRTTARRRMAGHPAASGVLAGRRQLPGVGQHPGNRHRTFHSYQARDDHAAAHFGHIARPL